MKLDERLAALEASAVPTWVFDAENFRQVWANPRALELWRAKSREELYARDYSDMTPATRARFKGYLEGFRLGHGAEEEWTLFPKGEPVTLKLFLSGILLDDGRMAALIQAFEKEKSPSPDLIRSIEALRHSTVMVTLLDQNTNIILQNPAAIRAYGAEPTFKSRFQEKDLTDRLTAIVLNGIPFNEEVLVETNEGNRWHELEARTIPDPVTGKTAILVHETDATIRRSAERNAAENGRIARELRETLAIVEHQRQEILSLAAPILEVSKRTLALPIIGFLDQTRAAEVEARTLKAVAEKNAEFVILDLTGADSLTTETATQVIRISQAIRLLGAKPIITGIRPDLARTLINANLNTLNLTLTRNLRDAITLARHQNGRE